MPRKQGFLFLYSCCFLSLFFGCKDAIDQKEEEMLSKKLSTDLVYNPNSLRQDEPKQNQPGTLKFVDTLHDFGRIQEGEVVTYEFEFENQGKKDILISEAKASCGCTVADFPKSPIPSKQKNRIRVTFDSKGKKGINDKGVTVSTNGIPAIYYLIIKAEVL